MHAMMNRSWAVHYFETTRLPRYSPVKRARIRAFFTKGYPGPYTIWGTNNGYGDLHISVLLFIAGGLVYFFNINHATFYAVVWWVGYKAKTYTYETVEVFFKPHNLFHTPLSQLALRIYLAISYVVFQVCSCISPLQGLSDNTRRHYYDLSNCYIEAGILVGKEKTADGITSEPSLEIDDLILERILLTLDEDHALEKFFDAIPGFCNSKLSVMPLSFLVRTKLRPALDGFLDRTFSSSLVSESVRATRLITCLNAAHAALEPGVVSQILGEIINGRRIEALQSVEIGHALRLWGHRRDHDLNIRQIIARIIAHAQRRDDRWTTLVKEAFGVPDGVLQDSLGHGDSVLLSTLIHVSRQANRTGSWTSGILPSLSKFDICNTLPGLQSDFCALWNEVAQEARNQGSFSTPAIILREIGHLYISLHQSTDAAATASFTSTDSLDSILYQPSLYPLCDIASHRPDFKLTRSMACVPVTNYRTVPSLTQPEQSPAASPFLPSPIESDHNTASQQAEEANVIAEPPSSKDYTPHPSHTHGFTPPPLATNSVHITLTSAIASPSAPESIGTSYDPRQSVPLAAGISATKFVLSDDPTLRIHPSESGETPQAPVEPLIFQHPDPVPATIMPSTGLDPGGDPDALQDTTSSATLSYSLQGNKHQDIVAPCAAPDIREIPSAFNPIPQSILTASTIVVPFSPSSPILLPALSRDLTTVEPPSFIESAPIQPDYVPHALRSPSSSLTTANSHDIHELNPSIPMTVLDQTARPAHDIVRATLQPEDQIQHNLNRL
jgi:hypothetical protein